MSGNDPHLPSRNVTLDSNGDGEMYQLYLSILRKHIPNPLSNRQIKLLKQPTAVSDGLILIGGPPHPRKKELVLWLILGLRIVGHKVLLTAPMFKDVDSTTFVSDTVLSTLIATVRIMLAANMAEASKAMLEQMLQTAEGLKGLRWLSAREDWKLMKCPRAIVQDRVLIGPSLDRKLEVLSDARLNHLRDTATKEDSMAHAAQARNDMIAFNKHKVAHDLARARYEEHFKKFISSPSEPERSFNYLSSVSSYHYVEAAKKALQTNPDIQDAFHVAVKKWDLLDQAFRTKLWMSKAAFDRDDKELCKAQEQVLVNMIQQADLVHCTCPSAQDVLLFAHFKPTVGIVMEAHRVDREVTQDTTWKYSDLQLMISSGDS